MRRRGFTLIELMVVIVVLSIATAIAVPRFSAIIPGAQLRSSGKRLANDMRYLYAYAIARREYVRLAIDLDEGEYWAETFTLEERETTGRVLTLRLRTDFSLAAESRQDDVAGAKALTDAVVGRRTLPEGIRFVEVGIADAVETRHGTVYIEFSPWGYGDDATVLLARGEARRLVRLNGLVGEAQLESAGT